MGRIDQETGLALAAARRRRWTWATVLTVGVVSASVLVAVPAIALGADPGTGDDSSDEKVVVCESGVIDHGNGIQTSSASADRVAADAPVPDGCTAG